MSKNLDSGLKIWRYMDLSSFISLIVNDAIYFPCSTEFQDPFEGHLPASHRKAMISLTKDLWGEIIKAQGGDEAELIKLHNYATEEVRRKNGVSCWHMNNYESEAMWKLYADKGISIESTIGQLQEALPGVVHENKIHIYKVRYADFENDEIDKGHEHYAFAIKRKSFEHEQELRASVQLPIEGQGVYVQCNLEKLITKIHVSPLARKHIRDDLEKLCGSLAKPLRKQIVRSSLYDLP